MTARIRHVRFEGEGDGLRKRGYAVLLERQEGKSSVYRISVDHDRAAAWTHATRTEQTLAGDPALHDLYAQIDRT